MSADLQPIDGKSRQAIDAAEAQLLQLPQLDLPPVHHFAPGIYARQMNAPAGSFIIGHCHKTENLNFVLKGRATVLCDGMVMEIRAPHTFVSKAGVRKVGYVHEDLVWVSVHPTTETDLEKLEELLVEKTPAYLAHEELLKLGVEPKKETPCLG